MLTVIAQLTIFFWDNGWLIVIFKVFILSKTRYIQINTKKYRAKCLIINSNFNYLKYVFKIINVKIQNWNEIRVLKFFYCFI